MLAPLLESREIYFTENEPMCAHTSIKIGGSADYFVRPKNRDELIFTVESCKKAGTAYVIVGNLTNTVFSDEGFRGAVISLLAYNGITVSGEELICDCGASLSAVAYTAFKSSLSGLEFSYGIPGCVGGAVAMNAGAYGSNISNVVKSVCAYDTEQDEIVCFDREDCNFSYRHSIFSDGRYIVLSAVFSLVKGDGDAIKAEMDRVSSLRKEKQPLDMPSAGSVFKRPDGRYVGQMIEELGLKGYSIGDAQVSAKHAGFIVNTGRATCRDLIDLISYIKSKVNDAYGMMLECEIKFF